MLERAADPRYRAIAKPNEHALQLLDLTLERLSEPIVGEIGVGIGATSLPLCQRLNGCGQIHFYDFAEKLAELEADLAAYGIKNVRFFGNTRKRYDSYNWSLLNNYRQSLSSNFDFSYDLVFLDGAHSFHHDAPATTLLKEMLSPGGIILFDDFNWSFAVSPTMNPTVNPRILDDYTEEQVKTCHVALICEAFMDTDPRFDKIDIGFKPNFEHRRAYRKRG